jgi:hypothetical protein
VTQAVEHLPSKYEALSSNPSTTKKKFRSQAWWDTPIIPTLGNLRQEDLEFKARLLYSKTLSQINTNKYEETNKKSLKLGSFFFSNILV